MSSCIEMKETFIKKYWEEESITFYMHFQDNVAVKQIEISSSGTKYLSTENSHVDGSMLYDQSFEELDLESKDIISKEEFETAWKQSAV
jgi:hypothetical protein